MLAEVQANVARQLLMHDVTASVEYDFDEFNRFAATAPQWSDKGNPAYDPAYNELTPENSFWNCFRDARGEIVWCSANKIYRDASFADLVRSNKLIYDGSKPPGPDRLELFSDDFDQIRGTICYIGSAWVHPKLRGNALPTLALALVQAKLLQDYDCDYVFAVIRHELMAKGVAINTYRFKHFNFGVRWIRADRGQSLDLWLMHQNRADMERELVEWVTPAQAAVPVRLIA
jgi:hypothetical protein